MSSFLENFADLEVLSASWPFLKSGLFNTAKLVVAAFGLALVVGGAVAAGRSSSNRLVRVGTGLYVDSMRALPPLVVLMVAYYVLPGFGLPSLSTFQAAFLGLGFIQGAFIGEILRGSVAAIEKGQIEAGLSIGLTVSKMARFVIVPQLIRLTIPPLTNQLTQTARDSALAFFIGYPELLTQARQAISILHNQTPLTATALMYATLLLSLQVVSVRMERHFYSEAVNR